MPILFNDRVVAGSQKPYINEVKEGSDYLVTSGAVYEALRDFNPNNDIEIEEYAVFESNGQTSIILNSGGSDFYTGSFLTNYIYFDAVFSNENDEIPLSFYVKPDQSLETILNKDDSDFSIKLQYINTNKFKVIFSTNNDLTSNQLKINFIAKVREKKNNSPYVFLEGTDSQVGGRDAHAEGYNVKSMGFASHAEGKESRANNTAAHSEGEKTQANGSASHSEGYSTKATGKASHTEGNDTEAIGEASHAEGHLTEASGEASHAQGLNTFARGSNSDAGGESSIAFGRNTFSRGAKTLALGGESKAFGTETFAGGERSSVEGYSGFNIVKDVERDPSDSLNLILKLKEDEALVGNPISTGRIYLFDKRTFVSLENYLVVGQTDLNKAEEILPTITFKCTTVDEANSVFDSIKYVINNNIELRVYNAGAVGGRAHAEGWSSYAAGHNSHAEGNLTKAKGHNSHAEGYDTVALHTDTHAEGRLTKAVGEASHAEGYRTEASGIFSHAEGSGTKTSSTAEYAHAENWATQARGVASHSEGYGTIAQVDYQHVQGKFNIIDEEGLYAHILGNGNANDERSNAHTIDWDGNAWFAGGIELTSPNGTRYRFTVSDDGILNVTRVEPS